MAELKRVRSLELEEDLRFQRFEWRVGTIAWIVLMATMIATGLGAFGNGLLSATRAGDEGGPLSVEYDRFVRFGSSRRVAVHARADADGAVRMIVTRPLLDALQVTQVTPPPAATLLVADGVEYRFAAEPGAQTPVMLDIQPQQRWIIEGEIRTPDAAVRLRQFIYP